MFFVGNRVILQFINAQKVQWVEIVHRKWFCTTTWNCVNHIFLFFWLCSSHIEILVIFNDSHFVWSICMICHHVNLIEPNSFLKVVIQGSDNINRAIHGDIVIVKVCHASSRGFQNYQFMYLFLWLLYLFLLPKFFNAISWLKKFQLYFVIPPILNILVSRTQIDSFAALHVNSAFNSKLNTVCFFLKFLFLND